MRMIAFCLCVVALTSCSKSSNTTSSGGTGEPDRSDKKNGDTDLEKLVIGTWEQKVDQPDGSMILGRTTYIQGGVFNLRGTITKKDKQIQIVGSGTWKVKDSMLHWTLETSNVPQFLPNGFKSADKIVSVNDKELTLLDPETQEKRSSQRVK